MLVRIRKMARFELGFILLLLSSLAVTQLECTENDGKEEPRFQSHGCAVGEFLCRKSLKCLAQRYWCDDVKDCKEGEDEHETTCGEKTSGFGRNFLRRIADSAAQDQCLPTFEKTTKGCELKRKPRRCNCLGYNIRCDNLSLTQVLTFDEEMVDADTPSYSFARNRIQYLQDNIFYLLPRLQQLDLRRNAISGFNIRAFNGLVELRKLHLDHNKLSRIDPRAFWPLSRLCFLWLGQNQLQNWEPYTFNNTRLRWLELKANKLTLEPGMFVNLSSLYYLELERNEIRFISKDKLLGLSGLYYLDLSGNFIEHIDEDSFEATPSLEELSLADNFFTDLPEKLFASTPNLQFLNLSNNPGLKSLPMEIFRGLTKIDRLNLSGITISNIHREMFDDVPDNALVIFSKFHYCYYAAHIVDCFPKSDGISSSENLIELEIARNLIWVLIALIPLSNLFVLIARYMISRKIDPSLYISEAYYKHEHRVMSKLRYNLFASNSLMTVYLLVIAIYDIEFREDYHREAYKWLHGWTCPLAGLTASLSIFLSLMTLVAIILDRTFCLMYGSRSPIGQRTATILIISFWIFGLLLFGFPISVWDNVTGSFYGNNGLCIPLYLDEPFLNGWWYSSLLFFGVFFVCLVITVACAIKIRHVRMTTGAHNDEFTLNLLVCKRYLLIVVVNLVCWLPVIIIKLMAFTSFDIANMIHSVFAVLILPLNSFLTPVIYVYLSSDFRRKFAKLMAQGRGAHTDCFRPRSNSDFKPDIVLDNHHITESHGHRGASSRRSSPSARPFLSPRSRIPSPERRESQNDAGNLNTDQRYRPRSC